MRSLKHYDQVPQGKNNCGSDVYERKVQTYNVRPKNSVDFKKNGNSAKILKVL